MVGSRAWWQVLLALLAAGPFSGVLSQDLSAIPVGCFSYGYKFYPALPNISGMPFTVNNVLECQAKCRRTTGCYHFAFFQSNGQCWMGDLKSRIIRAATRGVISGPAFCTREAEAACSDIPGPEFPASTAAASRAAWPGGEQPTNLQCWPRLQSGFPDRCHSRMATVLEDTAAGWPGRCDNMRRINDLGPAETCQLRCFNSALCGVWAVENQSQVGQVTCWHGMNAMNCYNGNGIPPMRAQRIMHGAFRVLMNTMGMQIMNLTRAFDTTGVPTVKDGIRRCRKTCLSYLFCQFWQYSTVWGCWIEDPAASKVAYPLVNDGHSLIVEVDSANSVKAGEYIQHFCADEPTVPLPTDSPETGAVAAPQTGKVALAGVNNGHDTLREEDGQSPIAVERGARMQAGEVVQEGMPTWAAILIGVAIALCLVVVGLVVWVTVIEADKPGTRNLRYGSPGSYRGDSRQSSFSEAHPFMQHGHYNPHMQSFSVQGTPPPSHAFAEQAAQWLHTNAQARYSQPPPPQKYNGWM